jgi:hypothetical protein
MLLQRPRRESPRLHVEVWQQDAMQVLLPRYEETQMIRLFIFLACLGSREIPRRVEVKVVIEPVEWIEPITSEPEMVL